MEKKKQRKPFYKTLIGNLLILSVLCVLLYWLFFASLSLFTRHGKVQVVPQVTGLTVDSALTVLKNRGFQFQIDSIFDKEYELNKVVNQLPESGAKVKTGRIIILTVNKANPPLVEVPNLLGKSYRTAEAALKKLGLSIGDTTLIYDLAQGTILEQRFKGSILPAGTKVPEGSEIDLVISLGLSDETISVPDFISVKFPEAIQLLEEKGLRYTLLVDGNISDSSTALVYSQYPESRNEYGEPLRVYKGDNIEIRIAQNPTIEKRVYQKRPKQEQTEDDNEGASTGTEGDTRAPKRPTHSNTPSSESSTTEKTKPKETKPKEGSQQSSEGSQTQPKTRPQRN